MIRIDHHTCRRWRIVFRAFENPLSNQFDLIGRKRVGLLRHQWIIAADVGDEQTLVRLAGDKQRFFTLARLEQQGVLR